MKTYSPLPVHDLKLTAGPLKRRQETALRATIPATMAKTIETGRLDAFSLQWKEGMEKQPHYFWDSDTAKVLEGMAAALSLQPDPELEREYDRWVDCIVSAQQPDGYLNTYFTVVEPGKRFTNLGIKHELYCCGHLIEAAVAGWNFLGKRKLLDAMCRYADLLCRTFGPDGERRGWPGHQEIELALVKLYQVTGQERYLKLAKYFLDDRGVEPNLFVAEKAGIYEELLKYYQADVPVRKAVDAHGHAVRAVYMYSGMADVARLTNDSELLAACERMFQSIAEKRMYVTGGIGSSFYQEALTKDYDLTNGSLMYAESCASMGLAFFCQRMLNLTGDSKYAEILELVIFNGVLAGISLKGDAFFYTNYLEVDDNLQCYNSGATVRQEWFGCSCCPTSFARFLTQYQQFVCSAGEGELRLNLPVDCHIDTTLPGGAHVLADVAGGYPNRGVVTVTIREAAEFALSLRLPAWCRQATVRLGGEVLYSDEGGKYFTVKRRWQAGDQVTLELEMKPRFLHAASQITSNAGRVALKRGPVVYCCETFDDDFPVREFIVDTATAPQETVVEGLPADVVGLLCQGWQELPACRDKLYFEGEPTRRPAQLIAIPYSLWQNRGPSRMAVWIRE
jgi:hypothetical protein